MLPEESRCFSIPNHFTHAFQVMHELRERHELCDVIIRIDGQEFSAHKVVLAGCSPYLRAMFTNGMQETEKDEIDIEGIEPSTMAMLLQFMYKGSVEVTIENVQSLLEGASMLNLASLRNSCCQFLQQHLDVSNCLGIHSFADMFSCADLEVVARRYIYQHFLEIVNCDEFVQLSEEKLIDLLQSDQLQVSNERQVFEAASTWVEWDPKRRKKDAYNVMQQVRLALLDISFLEEMMQKREFVRDCDQVKNLIGMAIKTKSDNNALALISNRGQQLGIFVVGGRNGVDSQLKSMERYDFLREQWIPMGHMNIARTAVSSSSMDGVLYAVGGECAIAEQYHDDTMYLRCVEAYDPILKEWRRCPEMKIARSFVALCSAGGCLFALGGEDRNSSFNVVEKYDYKLESWSFAPSMRQKRAGAGVTVCDGKIYVAGGYDKTFHTDRASVECFDLETQEWSFIAEMENPRSGLVLIAVGHYLYAIGGRSRYHQYFDMGERYDTATQQWTDIASMNIPRAWPAAVTVDGKIYVMGGFDGIDRLRSVEVYDPEVGTWTFISNMNISRAGCGAAVL